MMKKILCLLFVLLGAPAFAQLQQAGGYGPSPITTNTSTQPTLTGNTTLANTSFVNNELIRSKATQQVPVTGGTYNTASTGTGLSVAPLVSGGAIQSIAAIISGGSGYLDNDTLRIAGGNLDAIVRVTNEVGGVVQTGGLQVLYGGTGYTSGATTGVMIPPVVGNETVVYTGALSSNVTIIQPAGTYLSASRQVVYINDTTGAFTLTVFLSNGSGGTIGSGIVIPQGTNHSCDVYGETDGVTDIWYAATPVCSTATNAGIAAAYLPINNPTSTGLLTAPTVSLGSSGSFANWSTISPFVDIPAATLTDNTGSGTIALRGAYSINAPTFASSNSETLTTGASLYIDAPIAGSNTTVGTLASLYTMGSIIDASTLTSSNSNVTGSSVPHVGTYRPGANQLGFSSNTTPAGYIDAAQNWNIPQLIVGTGATGSYANWSTTSPIFNIPTITLTDNTGSGTIALRGAYTINNCTFAANSAETLTNASCLYIGTAANGANTTITNSLSLQAAGPIMSNGLTLTGILKISGTAGASSLAPSIYSNISNELQFGVPGVAAGLIDSNGHWRIGGSGTPTIGANACGSTTQGTVSAGGNDQAFQLNVGTALVTSCVVTFASAFTTAPRAVILSAANATAAAAGSTLAYVSAISTTSFTITATAIAGASYYVLVY